MKILVTGAAGFIGSHTCDLLLDNHHIVMGIDDYSTGKQENVSDFVTRGGTMVMADVRMLGELNALMRDFKPDSIIHLAAQAAISVSQENPHLDLITNTIGTLQMLTAAKNNKVNRFVLASTSAVYREDDAPAKINEDWEVKPLSPYGCSKAAAEMYVRSMFINHVILRYGNVFGPRQYPIGGNQVIAKAIRHLVYGDEFYINGDGKQKRDFVYVGDVAYANMLAATSSEKRTFNISKGQAVSVNDMLGLLEQIYEIPHYPWDHNGLDDPRKNVCLDVSLASKKLSWRALTTLQDGLRKTARWMKFETFDKINMEEVWNTPRKSCGAA